ncbi:glycosyltransferase [Gammaproteobacteria bacterium]|nr:glycosyltransferase [Gammaproteobacteria bacterium]
MPGKNILHSVNIHQGGGRNLLLSLLDQHGNLKDSFAHILIDDRLVISDAIIAKGFDVRRYRPTIISRLSAEWWLYKNVNKKDTILCFGNLPPVFKIKGKVLVYIHNRYLIDDKKLSGFSIWVKLRISLERLWLKNRLSNVDEFIVQTPSMKNLMEKFTPKSLKVSVQPFVADAKGYERSGDQKKSLFDRKPTFLYVASAEPHKNHKALIDAWCLLAEEELKLKLIFTFDEVAFSDVALYLNQQKINCSLEIQNFGSLSHSSIIDLYKQVDALIYPSSFESFGLPLIEARQAGLDILAPEKDYVRDLIDPESTFDSSSPVSIAKSVKRYIGVTDKPVKITSAKWFISSLFNN